MRQWWVKTRCNQPAYSASVYRVDADVAQVNTGVLEFFRTVERPGARMGYDGTSLEPIVAYGAGEFLAFMPFGEKHWPGHLDCAENPCRDCQPLHESYVTVLAKADPR